jgi:RNA polymerase sigma-70 factor, ECF subfamily
MGLEEVRMLGDAFDSALSGAAVGDDASFALLYRDLQPALVRYLRTLSREHCDDVASETWLELTRSLASFTGAEPQFRSWVFTIARRKLIDRIRYEARRPSAEWDDDLTGDLVRDIADDVVELDETYRTLALVQTLPRDQAEAVLLRVVAGLDYADVAEVMGRTTGAVRVLVHRGLKRLADALSEQASGSGV